MLDSTGASVFGPTLLFPLSFFFDHTPAHFLLVRPQSCSVAVCLVALLFVSLGGRLIVGFPFRFLFVLFTTRRRHRRGAA